MKKILLSAFALFMAGFGMTNATIHTTVINIDQPANDTLLFALPVTIGVDQEIWTAYQYENGTWMRMMKFQPEYLVTAEDFTHGDVTVGTPTLPANAKVIGLALDGYDIGCEPTINGIYHEVTAWCRNIPRDMMELEGIDLMDGYPSFYPKGQLCTDTVTYRGYSLNGVDHPGVICTFDPEATATDPRPIVDIPFGNPDDPNMPFWYTGENIHLTLWICNWYDVVMKYRYMAYENAEAQIASMMRSGRFCFNSDSQYDVPFVLGVPLPYELPDHFLPAFRTPYFTNDVRVTFTDMDGVVTLKDEDGNVYNTADDGNFYSLDHTKTYEIIVDNKWSCGTVAFDDIYKDINLEIRKDLTGVEEVGAAKAVANVTYYNLAGQMSAQPVDGVNIVVTTYTDGTRSTSKVVK
jgi:hypothetical protein